MNTRQKMLAYPLLGLGLAVFSCIGIVPLLWFNPRVAMWAVLPIGLFQLFPILGLMIPWVLLGMRRSAAKAKSLTLCSYCEYPLDLNDGPVVCPECGCKRTPQEHEAAWADWRLWKR